MANSVSQTDCLQGLEALPEGCAQLIYLDPPFNTGKKRSYNDSFGDGDSYLAYMRPRMVLMHRALAPTGSLFFHCDRRASHSIKLLLDELFAAGDAPASARTNSPRKTARPPAQPGIFVNEIIWHYGLGAARGQRRLLSKHDVIFWYAKSRDYIFNPQRGAVTQAMLRKYCHVDGAGARFMMSYGKRYYLKGGKPLDDVWDIPAISPTSAERTGYHTQKPLALLRRIVQLASNEGDLVIDPFCGSGTALVAAHELGRVWLGFDVSAEASETAVRRTQFLI